ncbi:hypothetical protein B5M09_012179 [Aphanomyces astaci]|uniref:Uncharacterized protein n=1 Tax=Aphanomyces astaci TaxID=112090 RepID=A0A425CTV4_APHAT|nr:hypothetical protein B5M09_012179 [Aphanomyces astaci]
MRPAEYVSEEAPVGMQVGEPEGFTVTARVQRGVGDPVGVEESNDATKLAVMEGLEAKQLGIGECPDTEACGFGDVGVTEPETVHAVEASPGEDVAALELSGVVEVSAEFLALLPRFICSATG